MSYTRDEDGNYRRTVRCSHCYQMEHNRSSCPDRKEGLVKRIESYKTALAENDYGEDSYQRGRDQRYMEDAKGELDKMLNKGKGRVCSYCQESGHNRRTCQFRKSDIQSHTDKTRVFREKFVEKMAEIGLGVGAIVRETIRTKDDEVSALAFVESVNWYGVDHRNKYSSGDYYMRCPNIVGLRILGDYTNRWNDKIETTTGHGPPNTVNTDDIEVDAACMERSMSSYPGVTVVSGVDVVHPPSDYFDDEAISKLVIREMVDTK